MEHVLKHVGLVSIPIRSKEFVRNVLRLVLNAFLVIFVPVAILHPSILTSSEKVVWLLVRMVTSQILPFLVSYVQKNVCIAVRHSIIALNVMETITCLVISRTNAWEIVLINTTLIQQVNAPHACHLVYSVFPDQPVFHVFLKHTTFIMETVLHHVLLDTILHQIYVKVVIKLVFSVMEIA